MTDEWAPVEARNVVSTRANPKPFWCSGFRLRL
jgi:hypothetical protein